MSLVALVAVLGMHTLSPSPWSQLPPVPGVRGVNYRYAVPPSSVALGSIGLTKEELLAHLRDDSYDPANAVPVTQIAGRLKFHWLVEASLSVWANVELNAQGLVVHVAITPDDQFTPAERKKLMKPQEIYTGLYALQNDVPFFMLENGKTAPTPSWNYEPSDGCQVTRNDNYASGVKLFTRDGPRTPHMNLINKCVVADDANGHYCRIWWCFEATTEDAVDNVVKMESGVGDGVPPLPFQIVKNPPRYELLASGSAFNELPKDPNLRARCWATQLAHGMGDHMSWWPITGHVDSSKRTVYPSAADWRQKFESVDNCRGPEPLMSMFHYTFAGGIEPEPAVPLGYLETSGGRMYITPLGNDFKISMRWEAK